MNAGHALWQFANDISIGDIIFAKQGVNFILGHGIVTSGYIYDPKRSEFHHIRQVNWIHKGEWENPGHGVLKTLTDITRYTENIGKLETLILGEAASFDQDDDEIKYAKYYEMDFLIDVYISRGRYAALKGLLTRKKNVILQGVPGVGKTFAAKRLAFSIMGEKDTSRVQVVQFHQSYSYEDFVMGFRPDGNGFHLAEGPFYKFCKTAEEDDDRPYFCIIDEINRGNLSKIFGELLMLIESDKRGEEIRLLYKNEMFSVPKNVHIIGMMNTADRSLAMIDYALRRRFAFFDMEPAFQSSGFKARQVEIDNAKYNKLVSVVEDINADIEVSLGAGFRIGHSYFCMDGDVDDEWLSSVVEYEIVSLLSEYWFDDLSKAEDKVNLLRAAING